VQGVLGHLLMHPSSLGGRIAVDTCRPDFGKVRVDVHGRVMRWVARLDRCGEGLRVPVRGWSMAVGGRG
jgi:hypothetical protein